MTEAPLHSESIKPTGEPPSNCLGEGSGPSLGAFGTVACIVLLAGALWGGYFASQKMTPRSAAPVIAASGELAPFTLIDRTGKTVHRSDLEGRYVIVNFVFTSCGSSCLEVSRRMAEIERRLAGDPEVRLLSVTIDPRTDTVPVLEQFGRKVGATVSESWFFLTGPPGEVMQLVDKSLLPGFDDPAADPSIRIDGPTRIGLIDRQGRLRAYVDGLSRNAPAVVLETLERLREEIRP